jgi:hypothetical protein
MYWFFVGGILHRVRTKNFLQSGYLMVPEGRFLFRDQPHSKLITLSYPIWRELFSLNF